MGIDKAPLGTASRASLTYGQLVVIESNLACSKLVLPYCSSIAQVYDQNRKIDTHLIVFIIEDGSH
jgi:hypothetical protein